MAQMAWTAPPTTMVRGPMARILAKTAPATEPKPSRPKPSRPKPSRPKPSFGGAKPKGNKAAVIDPARNLAAFKKLRKAHADAHCELEHNNPFELIVATVLSAQTTDVNVNRVTPGLFA